MDFLNKKFGTGSELQMYDPLDVMYRENPEIGSLLYANKENLLDDRILPYIAGFRNLQHQEKLALMENITQRMAIESDENKTRAMVNGQVEMTNISETNETERVGLSESGLTKRTAIEANALVDVQKTKYEVKRQIAHDYVNGNKYISDNEFKAVKTEAEALKDTIIFTESLKTKAMMQLSQNELVARVKDAEIQYAMKIKEAETFRITELSKDKRDIVNNYVEQQSMLVRAMIIFESEKIRADVENTGKSYETLDSIAEKGFQTMAKLGKNKMNVKGQTGHGNIDLSIEMED